MTKKDLQFILQQGEGKDIVEKSKRLSQK